MMNIFETISDSILEQLKGNLSGVKTIDYYEGQFEEESLTRVINYFPAVFLSLAKVDGGDLTENGLIIFARITWDLYVAAKNLRSRKEALKGALDIVENATSVLNAYQPANHGPLKFQDAEQIVNLPGLIVYRISFEHQIKFYRRLS